MTLCLCRYFFPLNHLRKEALHPIVYSKLAAQYFRRFRVTFRLLSNGSILVPCQINTKSGKAIIYAGNFSPGWAAVDSLVIFFTSSQHYLTKSSFSRGLKILELQFYTLRQWN